MENQIFYQASVSKNDYDEYSPATWEVYANRKDSNGIPATFRVGTFYSEAEAIEMAGEINER